MNKFLKSAYFKALLVVSAIAVVMLGKEVAGFVLFLNIIGFVLIACKETAVSFLPFMLACTFVVKCYDSFSLFAPLWWAYIFPLCAVAFHFIYYRKEHRFAIGQSFYGIIAVAAAVTLGGIGKISAAEYFSPMALYYVFGLGIGMAGIYLLLKSSFLEYDGYSSRKNFIYDMYIIGLFACFMILHHYAINFRTTLLEHKPANIQWSNNISTILMLAMPVPLFFTKKHFAHIFSSLLMYACAVLSDSRAGLILGTVEMIICLIPFIGFGRSRARMMIRFAFVICSAVAGYFILSKIWSLLYSENFIRDNEARVKLIYRAIDDFRGSPIFGIGLGNRANTDIYPSSVMGTICWYHMMIPQIFGSMGVVGVLGYGYQLVARFILVLRKRSAEAITLGLSYLGLFLMSQVNPGEFCPMPYALVATLIFVLVESCENARKKPTEEES